MKRIFYLFLFFLFAAFTQAEESAPSLLSFSRDFVGIETPETITSTRCSVRENRSVIAEAYEKGRPFYENRCSSDVMEEMVSSAEGRFFRLGDIRGYLVVEVLYAYSNSKYALLPESLKCLFEYAETTLIKSQTWTDFVIYTSFLADILDLIYMYDLLQYLNEEDLDTIFNYLLRVINRNEDIRIALNDAIKLSKLRLDEEFRQIFASRRILDWFRSWRFKRNDTLAKNKLFSADAINYVIEKVSGNSYYLEYVPYKTIAGKRWNANPCSHLDVEFAESMLGPYYSRKNKALVTLWACAVYRYKKYHGKLPVSLQEIILSDLFEGIKDNGLNKTSFVTNLPLVYTVDGSCFTVMGGPEYRCLQGCQGKPVGETFYYGCG